MPENRSGIKDPDALQRDRTGLGKGRGLFVPSRLWRQSALRHAYVLREPAHVTEDVCEHVLTRPEQRRGAARPAMSDPSTWC